MYLHNMINKYAPRDLASYFGEIYNLKDTLMRWGHTNYKYIGTLDAGSRAKGTAIGGSIAIASDVDYMVSFEKDIWKNSGGLEDAYNSLHECLKVKYGSVRKQNVSIRVTIMPGFGIPPLEVDITPARKQAGNTNDHSLYVSKQNSWKQTNVKKHIDDILNSGRTNEIKLLKIWRGLNRLDFPSIYLEYLTIDILSGKRRCESSYYDYHDILEQNFIYVLSELAKTDDNPLLKKKGDPAHSGNILSDLLTQEEKGRIYRQAGSAISKSSWSDIIY